MLFRSGIAFIGAVAGHVKEVAGHASPEAGRLCFQDLRTVWYPPYFQPLEDGVLALWFEWRPALKCLDLWVLTSGGPAVFGAVLKPCRTLRFVAPAAGNLR